MVPETRTLVKRSGNHHHRAESVAKLPLFRRVNTAGLVVSTAPGHLRKSEG